MRTTVTLDADAERLVRRAMKERGLTFKQALNDAIRAGAAPRSSEATSFAVFEMGQPTVDLTKALQLAGRLEDEELVRKLAQGR